MDTKTIFLIAYMFVVLFPFALSYYKLLKSGMIQGNYYSSRIIFLDTLLVCVLFSIPLIIFEGFGEPNNLDKSLQLNITQFIGTILAIFFSLAIFPIQNVVNNTHFSLVNKIIKNKTLTKGFAILTVIFLTVSGQLIIEVNQLVSVINFIYLIIGTITFILIIYESLRLIDVKNVISDYEDDAIFNLDFRWKKITDKNTDLQTQLNDMAFIKNVLIDETKIRLDPIFITTKKYIVLDQPEIVIRGFKAMVNIATKYIELFKFSVQDNDKLLLYFIERFGDFKNVVNINTHYAILPQMVSAIKVVSIKSLEITTPMSKINQSYLQLGLISTLKKFVISSDILQENLSSPMDAILALEEIGINAISKDNFNISRQIIEQISEISVACTRFNTIYSDELSKEANRCILNLHYYFIKQFKKYDHLENYLDDTLLKPIEAFIEVGEDNTTKGNLAPFIGTSIDPLNLTDFYSMRTFNSLPYIVLYLLDKDQVSENVVYGYIEEILQGLNQLVMKANKKKMFFLVKEIVETTYDISFILHELYEMKKIKDVQSIQTIMHNRILYIFSNSIYGSITQKDTWFDDKLNRWTSVIGMYLVVFQDWEGFPEKSIDKLIGYVNSCIPNLFETFENHEYSKHEVVSDAQDLIQFLNLILYWETNLLGNKSIHKRLTMFILENENKIYKHNYRGKRLPRDFEMFSDDWTLIQPYVAYYSHILQYFKLLLNVGNKNKYMFEEIMDRSAYIYLIIQIIKFRLGLIPYFDLRPQIPKYSSVF